MCATSVYRVSRDVRLTEQDVIPEIILSQKRLICRDHGLLCIDGKSNKLQKKEVHFMFMFVKSTVTVDVVYYSCRLFKVASICCSRFSDLYDQVVCHYLKRHGVIYVSWSAENLCPSVMLTFCAYTIDLM